MDVVAPCVMIGLGIGRIGCFLNGCCYGAVCSDKFPLAVTYPYGTTPYIEQVYEGKKQAPPELLFDTGVRDRLITRDELRLGHLGGSRHPNLGVAVPDDAKQVAATERSLPVHPAQLYSTFTALLIAAICVCYFSLMPAPGRVMALMLLLEGPTRFILEMLRSEPVVGAPGLHWSYSMYIGVGLFAAGIVMWFVMGHLDDRQRDAREPAATPTPAAA
jgi:phosphatidylglycerol:prolipoprotein diacylglycerol transferase